MKNTIKLPFRSRPHNNEALTSWIQRSAQENMITTTEMLKYANVIKKIPGKDKSCFECNSTVLNIEKLSQITSVSPEEIEKLTFRKGQIIFSNNFKGQFMNSFNRVRKFCPKCLREYGYYKLFWQVKEIQVCVEHELKLLSRCNCCGNSISCLPIYTFMLCPCCGADLTIQKSEKASEKEIVSHKRIIEDWEYIKNTKGSLIPRLQGFPDIEPVRVLAAALLYITLKNNQTKISSSSFCLPQKLAKRLISIIRGNTINNLGLVKVLEILRIMNISCEEFSLLEVPNSFYYDIAKPVVFKSNAEFKCISPWCISYQEQGSLKLKSRGPVKYNGSTCNHKFFCKDCGVIFTKKNGNLIEMGNWIDLAWKIVRPGLTKGKSIEQISKETKEKYDTIYKCYIFLSANELLPRKIGYWPENYDDNYLQKIEKLCGMKGKNEKNAQQLWGWERTKFLFYTFKPQSINLLIFNHNPDKEKELKHEVERALEVLRENEEPITIENVCKIMGVTKLVLDKYGVKEIIKKAKQDYKLLERKKKEKELLEKAQNLIKVMVEEEFFLDKTDFWSRLGFYSKKKTKYPETAQKIAEMLEEGIQKVAGKNEGQLVDKTKTIINEFNNKGETVTIKKLAYELELPYEYVRSSKALREVYDNFTMQL